jgi:hypothetical protein
MHGHVKFRPNQPKGNSNQTPIWALILFWVLKHETIQDFLEGKSTDYIIMWESRKTKLSHYHYSVDTTVHTLQNYKFTRYYNTWQHIYVQCITAETHAEQHQSRRSVSAGEGSSFTANNQSRRRMSAEVDFISTTKLEHRNETTYSF